VEFIFIFAVIFIKMLFLNFFEIMEIIRALWIYTFMDDEVFTVFFMREVVTAMRAFQDSSFGKAIIPGWRKMCLADFAQKLTFLFAIIPHQIIHGSITYRAGTVLWNVAVVTSEYRLEGFAIAFFVVTDEIFPVPILFIGYDFWKLINPEFLIFR
jgi:hypothetical protein